MTHADSSLPLDDLAAEFAGRLRAGERPDMEVYILQRPELAGQIRELFPTIEAMEQLKHRKHREQQRAGRHPQRLDDFRILAEVGRGGMGIVYEAIQESLQRRVALKVLPRHSTWDERRLRRFRREAKTAAQLHHANIVPVLGVGEDDGFHYIVMQYIQGVGLDEVIDALTRAAPDGLMPEAIEAASPTATTATRRQLAGEIHKLADNGCPPTATGPRRERPERRALASRVDRRSSGLGRAAITAPAAERTTRASHLAESLVSSDLRPRQNNSQSPDDDTRPTPAPPGGRAARQRYWKNIARMIAQAADGLGFAHQQGTTHRDVKPSNLLLDTHGNVWVADFGLAKAVEQDGISHSNDIVGTLRYMAPEQLRGQSDVRSDVYSLGLALFELLTLQPAFNDQQRRTHLLDPTHAAALPRPRKINPAIPRDLETIVLRAAAPEPRHRYATAQQMAADLRAYLDDRPIQARRVSVVGRLARWCRRNRALATASSAALLLLVLTAVIASVGFWTTRRANFATQRALSRETQARLETEATLDISLEALDRVYQRFAPDRLSDAESLAVPGGSNWEPPPTPPINAADAAMLEDILTIYDRLAEQNAGGGRRLAAEAARAHRRVGEIHQRLGNYDRAAAGYLRAIGRYDQLAAGQPPGQLVMERARIFNDLGAVRNRQGDPRAAQQAHQQALQLLLPQGPPLDWSALPAAIRLEVARSDYLRHRHRAGNGRRVKSLLRRAEMLLQQLQREDPRAGDCRHLLALCRRELADDPFSPSAEEAIALLEELVCDFPGAADYRFDLIVSCAAGDVRSGFQRSRYERRLRRASEHSRQLQAGHPNVREYMQAHAHVLQRLGSLLSAKADALAEPQREATLQEAEQLLRQAVAQQQQLVERFADAPAFRFYLANAQSALADLLLERGDAAEAELFCDRAIGQLYGLSPSRSNHSMLATTFRILARVHKARNRPGDAADAAENAAFHQRQFLK